MLNWLRRWLTGRSKPDKMKASSDALMRAEAIRLRALDQYLEVMTEKGK